MLCTGFNELGPEDVSLLERCPHFRGCYVQASMELGPEDVSLLERCPHFRGYYVQLSLFISEGVMHSTVEVVQLLQSKSSNTGFRTHLMRSTIQTGRV